MLEYLPQEVLVDIFLRLSTRSIIQCTAVCKPWYSLITSSTFISAHLNRNQDDHLLVRICAGFPLDKTPPEEIYVLCCDDENLNLYAQLDFPFQCEFYFNIIGNCNGLLCLSDDVLRYNDIYYLWNPSIKKSIQLPQPIFTFWTHGPFDHTLGFGFNRVANDYKMVRIVHIGGTYYKEPPHVELYKLSTGIWQDVTHVAPPFRFFSKIPGVYVNGACHWVASKQGTGGSHNMIVLFDMHEERFREMIIPGCFVEKHWIFGNEFVLFVSDNSLCLALTDKPTTAWESLSPESTSFGNDKNIDIWMMKEYGNPESWVKQFSISLQHTGFTVEVDDEVYAMHHGGHNYQEVHFLRKPVASRENGEILCVTYKGLMVSYDPLAKKTTNLGICNANFSVYRDALHVSNYKESLILLGKRPDYCAEDTSEESSSLCEREPKSGNRVLKGNTESSIADCISIADQ